MPATNKVQDLFNVNGLVAVVTGGGSGLGLYAARALDANGAKAVYIVGRREQVLQEAAKTGVNGTIKPIVGDVTDKASLERITAQIKQEQGYVNFLFANAGAIGTMDRAALDNANPKGSAQTVQKVLWATQDQSRILDVNITGTYNTIIAFLDLLDAGNKKGNVVQDSSVLVTSSIAGYSRKFAFSMSYGISKAAVNHMVKQLSTLFAEQDLRIRVNAVNPGLYPSEMTANILGGAPTFNQGKDGAFADAIALPVEKSPALRTGSEEDFAGLILFLASHAGAYVNGDTLISDGGRMGQMPSTY